MSEQAIDFGRIARACGDAADHLKQVIVDRERNKSGIRPIGGYVVIELPKAQEKTAGGIFLPQDQAEKEKYGTTNGTVIAAADDVRYGLAVGQRVAFARYAGTTIKGVDGEDYRLLLDEDVKGIFDGA